MITTEELYELYIKILKLNKNKEYYSTEAVEHFMEKLIEKSKKNIANG